jgi:hypothetical protein
MAVVCGSDVTDAPEGHCTGSAEATNLADVVSSI